MTRSGPRRTPRPPAGRRRSRPTSRSSSRCSCPVGSSWCSAPAGTRTICMPISSGRAGPTSCAARSRMARPSGRSASTSPSSRPAGPTWARRSSTSSSRTIPRGWAATSSAGTGSAMSTRCRPGSGGPGWTSTPRRPSAPTTPRSSSGSRTSDHNLYLVGAWRKQLGEGHRAWLTGRTDSTSSPASPPRTASRPARACSGRSSSCRPGSPGPAATAIAPAS